MTNAGLRTDPASTRIFPRSSRAGNSARARVCYTRLPLALLRPSKSVIRTSLAVSFFLVGPAVPAHDSPEHVIEALTARMETAGQRPELLWRRATEYQALGDLKAAGSDLKRALKGKPDFLIALQDLARIQLTQGSTKQALRTIDRALRLTADETGKAPSHMLRAEILCARREFDAALRDCDLALEHVAGAELDWYLTRADIQRRLGKFDSAEVGLRQAYEQTGSAVLEAEWIDAMIDAGQYAKALERIELRLVEVRCQSSWLLRRARVRLAQGETGSAHRDLRTAITELNERLAGLIPEPSLLVDRGLAYALLGDTVLARRDLAAARKQGADASLLRRAEAVLSDRT